MLARNYAPEQLKAVLQSRDIPSTDADHFEVEKILSHRVDSRGETLYMVKWKDNDSHSSEIPYKNFDSKKTVSNYYTQKNLTNLHNLTRRAKQLQNKQQRLTLTL
ncbi:hypothetical protein BGZ83_003878 [Gryganskiella cystojenkinii]|nr:hypothetical protein BGZ83_003878 [Gryganskiella cystojenkinii]